MPPVKTHRKNADGKILPRQKMSPQVLAKDAKGNLQPTYITIDVYEKD